MDTVSIVNELKQILPKDNFRLQPDHSRQELSKLEEQYGITTEDLIKGNYITDIPTEVCDRWIAELDTFINFGGTRHANARTITSRTEQSLDLYSGS